MSRTVNRFLLGVQYQGDRYRGSLHVGELIAKALEMFNGAENYQNLDVSSRTDSRVHAIRNVWHVDLHLKDVVAKSEKRGDLVLRALNHFLRKENIIITDCISVPRTFECRRQAKYRTYMYRLIQTPSVPKTFKRNLFQNQYAWNVPSLNVAAMQSAANHLIGIHDFSSFRNAGCQSRSPFRHLWALDVKEEGRVGSEVDFSSLAPSSLGRDISSDPYLLSGYQLVTINVSANAFVYRMVRNIVSTLVEVGTGNMAPDDIPQLLAARDRLLVPAAAPAHGLFLVDVAYNKEELAQP